MKKTIITITVLCLINGFSTVSSAFSIVDQPADNSKGQDTPVEAVKPKVEDVRKQFDDPVLKPTIKENVQPKKFDDPLFKPNKMK